MSAAKHLSKLLKTSFKCNRCSARVRVRSMRMQTVVRCICGEVFRVTKDGYEFLNHLPDPRTIGISAEAKAMIDDGRIILATR